MRPENLATLEGLCNFLKDEAFSLFRIILYLSSCKQGVLFVLFGIQNHDLKPSLKPNEIYP